jgi:hypothetical protein
LPANENRWFSRRRKKVFSIENNAQSNRDDSDRVFIMTTDVDLVLSAGVGSSILRGGVEGIRWDPIGQRAESVSVKQGTAARLK